MLSRLLETCMVFAACGASCLAADASRPACNATNSGHMWPEAANRDHSVISKLAHCGQLLICVRGDWRYRWQPLTVRIDQLPGGSKLRKPSGCEVSTEPLDKSTEPTGTK